LCAPVSVVGNRRRIADIKEIIDPAIQAYALLDLAEQAEERGDLTASAIFVLASEVCRLRSALRGILRELISR